MARPLRPTVRLTLEALPRAHDPGTMVRLRRALKCLLRGFGLRCTWIEYPEPAAARPPRQLLLFPGK